MIPLRQRFRHNPARGVMGDCHRACPASLFELPLDAVPHFAHDQPSAEKFNARVEHWLAERNLAAANMPHGGTLPEVLRVLGLCSPHSYWLLAGRDATGANHTVIGRGGRIVHNPSHGSALVGPCRDGVFWVTYLVPRAPELLPTALRWAETHDPSRLERLVQRVRQWFSAALSLVST